MRTIHVKDLNLNPPTEIDMITELFETDCCDKKTLNVKYQQEFLDFISHEEFDRIPIEDTECMNDLMCQFIRAKVNRVILVRPKMESFIRTYQGDGNDVLHIGFIAYVLNYINFDYALILAKAIESDIHYNATHSKSRITFYDVLLRYHHFNVVSQLDDIVKSKDEIIENLSQNRFSNPFGKLFKRNKKSSAD